MGAHQEVARQLALLHDRHPADRPRHGDVTRKSKAVLECLWGSVRVHVNSTEQRTARVLTRFALLVDGGRCGVRCGKRVNVERTGDLRNSGAPSILTLRVIS